MVAVTYGVARAAAKSARTHALAAKTKSFFRRMFNAMMDAQMRRAEREVALHRGMFLTENNRRGTR